MTDLVPVNDLAAIPAATRWVEMLTPAAQLAQQIAGTEFVPTQFRSKPAAIAAAILYGQEIGIGPMQALAKIDIVEGRPAPRAELARALALAAGHELWVSEQTTTKCTVNGRRRGSSEVQTVTWTMDDAKKAGLAGRPNYAKYPRQMLLARASAELVRMMCPDVLGGIAYFAEELEGDNEPVNPPIAATIDGPPPGTQRRQRKPVAAPAPQAVSAPVEEAADELPPLPGEDDEPPVEDVEILATDAQIKHLQTLYSRLGVPEPERKQATAQELGLDHLASHKNLTVEQASTLIDRLRNLADLGEADQPSLNGVS